MRNLHNKHDNNLVKRNSTDNCSSCKLLPRITVGLHDCHNQAKKTTSVSAEQLWPVSFKSWSFQEIYINKLQEI